MMTPAVRRFTFTTHITRPSAGSARSGVPRAGRHWIHQRGRANRARRVPVMAPAAWLYRSFSACFAAQRNRLVARHAVGPVSALLGCSEVGHNGLRDRDPADLHGNVQADGRRRGRPSDGSGRCAKRVADRSRRLGVGPIACCNSAGRLQAFWDDRLWEAEVRRAAAGGFSTPWQVRGRRMISTLAVPLRGFTWLALWRSVSHCCSSSCT